MAAADATIRLAGPDDAGTVARLLAQFDAEYDFPVDDEGELAARIERLLAEDEMTVLFIGGGPEGFAQLRFRPGVSTPGLDAYLEELYVVPERRGQGLGRALLEAAMDTAREKGATRIDLGTSEADKEAIGLYESAGFTNLEGGPGGPRMIYYERDL